MTKERKKFQPLTSSDICEIYKLLHSEGLVHFPLTNDAIGKLESTVTNINGVTFGVVNYVTVPEKIVAYLYFIIKNHPFTDGNKRTAVLTFLVLVRLNGLRENLIDYDLDSLAVFLEQVDAQDHQEVIRIVSKGIFS